MVVLIRVVDTAEKNRIASKDSPSTAAAINYITIPQLVVIINGLGLQMSPTEVELLATGFASDGKGGIDSEEFCNMVHTLVYNVLGSHGNELHRDRNNALTGSRHSTRRNTRRTNRQPDDDFSDEEIDRDVQRKAHLALLHEICDSIVNFDK